MKLRITGLTIFFVQILAVLLLLHISIFGVPKNSPQSSNEIALSSLGDVNLFNGSLNMRFPLISIGGRGNTQIPLNLSLNRSWKKYYYSYNQSGHLDCPFDVDGARPVILGICSPYTTNPQPAKLMIFPRLYNGLEWNTSGWEPELFQYNPGLLVGKTMVAKTDECTHPNSQLKSFNLTASRFYLEFTASDGSAIELVDKNTMGKFRENTSNVCGQFSSGASFLRGDTFISTNGSAIKFVSDTAIGIEGQTNNSYGVDTSMLMSGYLYMPNGSTYRIDEGVISWIKDVNGNKTTFTYYTPASVSQPKKLHTATDSLGRTVTIEYDVQDETPYGLCDRIKFKSLGGEDKIIRISKTNLSNALLSGYALQTPSQMWPARCDGTCGGNSTLFNPIVNSSVWLPDGTAYKFQYNSFLEVSRVESPTGAAIEYDHDYPGEQSSNYEYSSLARVVKEKRIYADASNAASLQSKIKYSRTVQPNQPSHTTVTIDQTDANDVLISRANSYFYGSPQFGYQSPEYIAPYGIASWKNGYNYRTDVFANNGTTLLQRSLSETKNKTVPWISDQDKAPTYDTRPTRQVLITLENGKALVVLKKNEYDENGSSDQAYFSHLNVKKSKAYNYKVLDLNTAQNGDIETIAGMFSENDLASAVETDYLYDENYKAKGIIGLLSETRILNPANSTDILAKSQIKYDEVAYSLIDEGTTVGYEAPTGANPHLRGNATTTRRWVKETDTWLDAHAQYDNFGNLRKVWDISGDPTRLTETIYEHSAEKPYYFAYPTKVITPAPDPTDTHGTNQGSQVETTYDFNTGLPLTVKNEFGQITRTEYDSNLRPYRTFAENFSAPETQTLYGIPDASGQLPPNQRFVKVRKQIDSQNWEEAVKWFDGLGRSVKATATDSQGTITTETKYDAFGRVEQTTNPYRAGDTVLWNKVRYDEAGRTVEGYAPAPLGQTGASLGVKSFDISTVAGFVGTVGISTDASGRKHRSITNALGQLLRVDEATATGGTETADLGTLAAPHQPTFYQYDERGNLKEVNQGGQTRTFTYDSFSRIKSANNPESGIVNYTYDLFGNLKTKRDARGIKTIYDYDKFNRIIKRCYRVVGTGANSLGATNCADAGSETVEPNTPDVSYFYDGKGLAQQQSPNYAKGKLTKVSSSASETLYTNFDNLGRLMNHQQITDGQTYSTSYKYNFNGSLAEQTYPSGKVVRNFYEADGDLASTVSNGKIHASNFSYTAAGAIEKMRLGNGNWESTQFNNKLQPVQIGLGNAANNTTNLWKVNYEYGELQADGTTVDANKNNGNIAKQTITVPTINGQSGFVATQVYAYDSLNRLKQARETIGGQTNWQQIFTYDRFGNRNLDEANTTTLPKACLENSLPVVCAADRKYMNPAINQANNRLAAADGYEYDANGNVTKDSEGRQFTYDALNKQKLVKNAGNQPIGDYIYDGDGRRVKKLGSTENTLFVYDGFGSLIAEYAITSPPLNPAPNTSYLTTDTLGSPRVVTGKNGEVLSRRDFLPFGEEITAAEANRKAALGYTYGNGNITRQAFTGYEKDTETDLEFAQNRYYSNKLGRFTSVDPLMASGKVWNPQSWNRYAYVNNNPLNLTDPLGLDPEKKAWWYTPCAGCNPIFGTGYTDQSQLINPNGLIYTNLAISPDIWALNPITGAYLNFANTAEGMAEAMKWMAAGGATAVLIAEMFGAVVAGAGVAVGIIVGAPIGDAESQILQNAVGTNSDDPANPINVGRREFNEMLSDWGVNPWDYMVSADADAAETPSSAPPVPNPATPSPDGGGQGPNKPTAPKIDSAQSAVDAASNWKSTKHAKQGWIHGTDAKTVFNDIAKKEGIALKSGQTGFKDRNGNYVGYHEATVQKNGSTRGTTLDINIGGKHHKIGFTQ